MKIGDKVKVNVPDEKWCHGCKGEVEAPSLGMRWLVRLDDVAPYTPNNPYEFHETELTVIEEVKTTRE